MINKFVLIFAYCKKANAWPSRQEFKFAELV